MKNQEIKNQEIKIGDFIKGSYKFGVIYGVVTEIKKSIVVINECTCHYEQYTMTTNLVNVTKTRIFQIGLYEGEKIINA
jgi:hypothetical protein